MVSRVPTGSSSLSDYCAEGPTKRKSKIEFDFILKGSCNIKSSINPLNLKTDSNILTNAFHNFSLNSQTLPWGLTFSFTVEIFRFSFKTIL